MNKYFKFCKILLETNFHIPNLNDEEEEFDLHSSALNIPKQELMKNPKMQDLSDFDWKNLENTDSWETDTVEKARNLAQEYDKDFDSILHAYKNKKSLPAPIVYKKSNGNLFLIGGNTRLMAAKALGIRPKVLMTGNHNEKLA